MEKTLQGVQSVGKAFSILEFLSGSGQALPPTDISAGCGMPLTTTHRFLHSLCELGYVENTNGRYYLTTKILQLCRHAVLNTDFLSIARPYLQTLSREIDSSVQIVVRDGQHAVYMDAVVNCTSPTNTITRIGHRLPLYRTAAGRSILATLTDEKVEEILQASDLVRTTRNTIVEIGRLMQEVQQVRSRGYAVNMEEDEVGVRCIATALTRPTDASAMPLQEIAYALSITFPANRLPGTRVHHIADELLKTRDAIMEAAVF